MAYNATSYIEFAKSTEILKIAYLVRNLGSRAQKSPKFSQKLGRGITIDLIVCKCMTYGSKCVWYRGIESSLESLRPIYDRPKLTLTSRGGLLSQVLTKISRPQF